MLFGLWMLLANWYTLKLDGGVTADVDWWIGYVIVILYFTGSLGYFARVWWEKRKNINEYC